MPTQETVYQKYWTWCKAWIVRYPCRKTRKVTKWCYQFDKGRVYRAFFTAGIKVAKKASSTSGRGLV